MSEQDIDRIIEMAWQDWVPFDAIKAQFGLSEGEVIKLMRRNLKPSSFRLWRKRAQNRKQKHAAKDQQGHVKFKNKHHREISNNKIT